MTTPRKTIAILSDSLLGDYQTLIRAAVESFAHSQDANLQFIVGRELDSPLQSHQIQNGIYNQISPDSVHGLIILTSTLSNFCGVSKISEFCTRFRPIPMCSIGIQVPGIPSIVMKNGSIRQLVDHLIAVHQKSQFAFIGGPESNPESLQRLAAVRDILKKRGLQLDPELVVSGNFVMHQGFEAALTLLQKKRPIDAIVAASDEMAIGAIAALKQKGIAVPGEIAVTGFDDLCASRYSVPKLTTMRQPFEEIGDIAVGILLGQLKGQPVPMLTEITPKAIIRHSCGCVQPHVSLLPPGIGNETPLDIDAQKMLLEAVLLTQVNLPGRSHVGWSAQLVDAFFAELEGGHDRFATALESLLNCAPRQPWVIDELHTAVTYLRANVQVQDSQKKTTEDIWHRARITLFNALAESHRNDRLALVRTNSILISRTPQTASSSPVSCKKMLQDVIYELLTVGIQNAAVSIFKDEQCTQLECIIAIRNGHQVKNQPMGYPATRLIPEFMNQGDRCSYVIFALTTEQEMLGVLALEHGSADSYYEMMSEYLSANIKLIALYQNRQREMKENAKTRQRALELQHRQKLESLGVLAGGIAHDFNNMLSVMAGNLDIIHMDMAKEDQSMEPVQECRAMVRHATGLVRQLLTYSGKDRFVVSRLNLNTVINELLDFLKMAVSKNVKLAVFPEATLPDIEGDTAQLQQILVNLVINASEAIEEAGVDGTISIETETQTLDSAYFETTISKEALAPGNYVLARVTDNGIGIDPATLQRIFDPFYTTKFGGRGLGLAAVLGIIRAHRGSMRARSQKGKGTCFEIAFPRLPAQSDHPRPLAASRPSQIGAGTILIVDDEPAVLKAGARLLQKMGFSTLEAHTGQQAIDLVSDFPEVIHCVIMDITMPGIGGIAAMAEIRKICPKTPVILTSGYSEAMALESPENTPPCIFLQKPYNMESLTQTVMTALNEHQVIKK